MMEQKCDPPTIFWAPDFIYIQIITMKFQKKSADCERKWKVSKGYKVV